MSKANKFLVNCANYNGNKNILFMMAADDFRLNDGNWQVISPANYDRKTKTLVAEGKQYKVFCDWSVRAV